MSERKASEVIADLDLRVKKMELLLSQIDVNIKRLINRDNMASSPPRGAWSNEIVPIQPKPTATASKKPPELMFNQVQGNPELINKPTEIKPSNISKSSKVDQKIMYDDGRPVILASVKIRDKEVATNIVANIKTDSHGRWSFQLPGGKYLVEVIKGPTAAKRGFKTEYDIEVPMDGKPLTLERKKVE